MEQFSDSPLGQAKTLLLATDGSGFSEGAVRAAIFFSQTCQAKIIVLHVVPTGTESIGAANLAVRRGWEELTPHFDRIRAMSRDSGVEMEIVSLGSSNLEKTLIEQARLRQADVILMGRRGVAGRWSRLVGKTTLRVIAQKFPRVLVVPKEFAFTGMRIMVAINDSPNSRQAALDALHLGQICPSLEEITVMSVAAREKERQLCAPLVEAVCDQARRMELSVPCRPRVEVGDPVKTIVKVAGERKIDMIVLGGPDQSWLTKLLKGDVAENIIGLGHCATLVVTAQNAANT